MITIWNASTSFLARIWGTVVTFQENVLRRQTVADDDLSDLEKGAILFVLSSDLTHYVHDLNRQ